MPKRKRPTVDDDARVPPPKDRDVPARRSSLPRPSGECSLCVCRAPADEVDSALARVRSAKSFVGSMPSRGPFNEQEVLRAICDDYLAHSRKAEDLKPKQVRLREAMRRVAVRLNMPFLAQFNCKTTSLRTLGRALWEGCSLASTPTHKAEELVLRQRMDGALVDSVFERLAAAYAAPITGADPRLPAPLDEHARRACQRDLQENGIAVLPGFVPEETCEWLLSRVCDHRAKHSPTWLTETMALGRRGCYFDKDWNLPVLKRIQSRLVEELGLSPTDISNGSSSSDSGTCRARLPPTNNKSVLLVYGEGAENWAHQDDNKDFAYQALLMLSQPGCDFSGGELYVLDGGAAWRKSRATFSRRGDVAVFRSNGAFFHGMEEVLAPGVSSRSSVCSRVAVGLLHKH